MASDGVRALSAAEAERSTSRRREPGGSSRARDSSREGADLRALRPTFTSSLREVDEENNEAERGLTMEQIRIRLEELRQDFYREIKKFIAIPTGFKGLGYFEEPNKEVMVHSCGHSLGVGRREIDRNESDVPARPLGPDTKGPTLQSLIGGVSN